MDSFGRITATAGSAMCTLCGYSSRVETNVDRAEGVATATAFALHFAIAHPEARAVARYVLMVPDTDGEATDDGR